MLELVFSNRAEALIEVLAERVAARQAGGGFWKPVPIVVPNPLVKRFVREGLASRNGGAANLDFHFLESLVGSALGKDRKLWTPEAITGRLLARFQETGALDGEVAAYLAGEGRDRRALQLAQRLGHLFFDYALHRPDWVAQWRNGKEAGDARWQGRLFAQVDRVLAQAGFVCPADLAKEAPRLAWPAGAFVVSLNSLAPAYLAMMERLRDKVDLTFLVLNPCEDYWGDLAARRDFLAGGDPPEGHPALGLWGRPGREFLARLYDLAEGQDETRFQPPGRDSLLRALQDDILARRAPQAFDAHEDRSLRVLAAPGPRREAEVVAGEIWRLLSDAPGGAPLRFSDIAVVIPAGDADAHLEHLRAAFEATGRLPLAFEAATTGSASLLSEACGLLLDLLGSDASRAAVLRFLRHPASAARHPDLDPQAALALCERTGILRGLDASAFEGTYLAGRDRIHWAQGLARMALAAFLPDGVSVPGRDLPALSAPDRDAALALASLIRDLRSWREQTTRHLEPLAWVEAFMALVEAHLGNGDEAWVRARAQARRRLEELARLAPEGLPAPRLSFEQARELMREKLALLDDRPEGGGGIRVSTGMPMRAAPFRAVFVMGLGEGVFPAVERGDPLDLRQRKADRRPGDLGRAEQDRYLFLELLLSARDALRLSYASADPLTGDPRPRSAVLEELMDILQTMTGDAEALVEQHPLRRFDPAYFQAGGLRSLAPEAAREAEALVTRKPVPLLELPPSSFPPDALRLPLARLRDWLEEPVQGAARIRLGLRGEDEDTAAESSEPVALDNPESSEVERAAVDAMLAGASADAALAQAWRGLELEGRAPLGPLGELARRELRIRLAAWSPALREDGPFRIHHFGETRPPLELDVPLDGRVIRVSIEGLTELVGPASFLKLVSKKPGAATALRHRMRMRLSQLALAASGEPVPGALAIQDAEGKSTEPAVIAAPTAEAARAQLVAWLQALLGRAPEERLPAAFATAKDRSAPQAWLDAEDRSRFVSSWGPVPLSILRQHPAPSEEEAEAQLRFRLGPLLPEREGV
ncbi:MAG TPA: exodeoxyribonuclease V subunit gamma [Holophagaceae bacterium]|jgi:exodeoxyribonuclease V gamma subunit|nr:exodeoxyribonuclease V subunit gamma [Holophagaceae bacterium]